MSALTQKGRQGLVATWVAQMIGTIVLSGVMLAFVRSSGSQFAGDADAEWKRYAIYGILAGTAPALLYLRRFKAILNQDIAREQNGVPDPASRLLLQKSLVLGGALCEIPMAMGVVQMFFGGETRWFLGATLVTIALRLSYRPFNRS
jgi:hypothetical protein